MPSFQEKYAAAAQVSIAGGAIDAPNTSANGCTVSRNGVGDYNIFLTEPMGPVQCCVLVGVRHAGGGGAGTQFAAAVVKLPAATDPIPYTQIRIEFALTTGELLTDPSGFFVLVERTAIDTL